MWNFGSEERCTIANGQERFLQDASLLIVSLAKGSEVRATKKLVLLPLFQIWSYNFPYYEE